MRTTSTALWGLFCACSWTWCIGMYLPVVLLQRYGWPGFAAFAVPNVLGCILFGFVVRTRERSERMVRDHAGAMRWFSAITVAYHVYFAGWLATDLLPETTRGGGLPVALPLALCAAGLLVSVLSDRSWLVGTVLVYGISITAFLTLLPSGLSGIPWTGSAPPRDAALVAPVLAFGFLLCPYLDPTFHRALQRSGAPFTFVVFGIAFAVMIVLTCAYWGRPGLRLEPFVARRGGRSG
ncbi:MAG: hypothetical protein ACYTJ0_14900 [Planctomycetota bacterium]